MIEHYDINGMAVTKYSPNNKTHAAPIIMVHGGDHGAWCWEKWANFFSEAGYEVHALNWYGHGESKKLPDNEFANRSIVDVAHTELKNVIEKLSDNPILIGHSMGGLASAIYASEHPVERLVLAAPVMPASVHPDPIPLPLEMGKPYPQFPYEQAKQLFFTKSSDEDAHRYYKLLVPESAQAVYEATRWSVNFDTTAIKAPVLVLAAEFDGLIPGDALKRYAEILRAGYKQISGVGHSDILLKEPEWQEAAIAVRDWLDS